MATNHIYIETPIDQTEGLEDGDYITLNRHHIVVKPHHQFLKGKWFDKTVFEEIYLRPAPDNSVVVSKEIVNMAFQWWLQNEEWCWHRNGYYYQLDYPDQWPAPRTATVKELWDKFTQTKLVHPPGGENEMNMSNIDNLRFAEWVAENGWKWYHIEQLWEKNMRKENEYKNKFIRKTTNELYQIFQQENKNS